MDTSCLAVWSVLWVTSTNNVPGLKYNVLSIIKVCSKTFDEIRSSTSWAKQNIQLREFLAHPIYVPFQVWLLNVFGI